MSTVLADANGVIGSSLGKVSIGAVAQVAQVFFLDTSDLEGVGSIHHAPSLHVALLGLKHLIVEIL